MSSPRPTPNPAARGAAIVLIASAIGLAVLLKGFSDDSPGTASAGPKAAVTTVPRGVVTTTPATPVTPSPGLTKVVVANAGGKTGLAGRYRDTLAGKGYTVVDVANAVKTVPVSAVYYREGHDLAAKALATGIGVKSDQVKLLSADVPRLDKAFSADAHVLVVIGVDLAK